MIGMGIVRSGCGQSGDRTLKLTVSERWTDDFLHVNTDSQKLKAGQTFFGWTWSKMYGHGQSGHRTLKLTVFEIIEFME